LLQSVYPVLHDRTTQLLLVQPDVAWASLQTLPHPPQLLWSVTVSTHAPASAAAAAQVVGSPGGQVHTPVTQLAPFAQAWPQAPQFFESLDSSTQTPPHRLSVAKLPHFVQTPLWQADIVGQDVPHPPQFAWSLLVSTHVPAHMLGWAAGQPQTLEMQLAPLGQTPVQLPQ